VTTLLLADHDNATLKDPTRRALTAALMLGESVHVLVAGENAAAVANQASALQGVTKVLHAEASSLGQGISEAISALILSISDQYTAVVAAATAVGKSVMPRVAAKLDVMQVSEVTAVLGSDTFERPIYAGNAVQAVRSKDKKLIITVRASAFAAAEFSGTAPIQKLCFKEEPCTPSLAGRTCSTSERPELTSAKIVVSGGRGLGSSENFEKVVATLADKIGAAVGASRAAVDAGFAPNEWQVGQTGKIIAPDLYIALGVSGAIQHIAGMKDAKTIVVINSDPDAPFFQVADYGLVADLFEATPQFLEELAK